MEFLLWFQIIRQLSIPTHPKISPNFTFWSINCHFLVLELFWPLFPWSSARLGLRSNNCSCQNFPLPLLWNDPCIHSEVILYSTVKLVHFEIKEQCNSDEGSMMNWKPALIFAISLLFFDLAMRDTIYRVPPNRLQLTSWWLKWSTRSCTVSSISLRVVESSGFSWVRIFNDSSILPSA